MKLVITSTTVVKGGKIAERGQIHNTGDVDPKEDQEAYALIAAGRAVTADSKEGQELLDAVAEEKKVSAAESKKGK